MTTLYRRYRPQKFSEVAGQDHVTKILQGAAQKNKLAHAYLFYGPRGTGKTTMARLLAKRVNCKNPTALESCDECASCRALMEGRHTDVIEIDAASNRGIDDVRRLRDHINLSPALGKYRVYVIDEVHMLTREAATALLKTLEEPVAHAIFVLATTELHKVLPTISSRCQVFRFKRAGRDEMINRLKFILQKEQRAVDDATLEFIIDRTDGCYRDAESLLGQLLTLGGKKVNQKDLQEFMGLPPIMTLEKFLAGMVIGKSAEALTAVEEAFQGGYDPEQFLKESIRLARDKAVQEVSGKERESERWPQIIRALLQALQDLSYVPQPMIALQLAVLSTCSAKGQDRATAQSEEKTAPARTEGRDENDIEAARITAVWPELIEEVKRSNPVAATFLRAVRPTAGRDRVITMHVQYALHQTFFDRPDSRELISSVLGKLLNQEISVVCVLDEDGTRRGPLMAEKRRQHENRFQRAVKEVFG